MAPQQPNILFVMADDHAAKAISCYGAGINSTPNLDRLAKEGTRFDHCYVTNSICTPSRATILTGTHNHVNQVLTLDSKINKRLPNVAKTLRAGGYQTAMVGKWHLGEGAAHEPSGFDYWSVLPGQGEYHDPPMIQMDGTTRVSPGYATDIITDKSLYWIKRRDKDKPFFLMCHHKAPHRAWECDSKHDHLYREKIKLPDTFNDDYKNRAQAASAAKIRIADDMTYGDLGLAEPDGGDAVGERLPDWGPTPPGKKVPDPKDTTKLRLIDKHTGENFTFTTSQELAEFKFQRYMGRYLRTIQSIDDNMGRMLDYLDSEPGLAENTIVIYTSDQGFFLGEHGWFDKRLMYEQSFQMPFLARFPAEIPVNSISKSIISNVDFAPTFLDLAGLRVPSYMQGASFRNLLANKPPTQEQETAIAYHRYWMHRDPIHNTYAHYGIRDRRYKLIYWYNEDFGIEGTNPGGEEKEWELFDCEQDPLELFNVYYEAGYRDLRIDMTRKLAEKMAEIGDEPVHAKGEAEWEHARPAVSEGLVEAKMSEVNM